MKPSEAIENIEYARGWLGSESDFSEEALDMAVFALKKLEQDRWYSVAKEGNPKENGFYLWTSKDGTVREDYYQVRGDTWSKAWQFGYEVIAWKKEPEPYTEEDNGTD